MAKSIYLYIQYKVQNINSQSPLCKILILNLKSIKIVLHVTKVKFFFFLSYSRSIWPRTETRKGAYPGGHAAEHQFQKSRKSAYRRTGGWPATAGHRRSRTPGNMWFYPRQGGADAGQGSHSTLIYRLPSYLGEWSLILAVDYMILVGARMVIIYNIDAIWSLWNGFELIMAFDR